MTMLKKISISMLALCALSSSAFAQEADLPYTATADGQTLTFKEDHNAAGGHDYYNYTYTNEVGETLNDLTIEATKPDSVFWIGFGITNLGTISGTSSITANGVDGFTLTNNGTISGTLTLKGENGALPYLQVGAGTVFSAGTSIVLAGGVVTFDNTDASVVWNVTEETLGTALFSGSGSITRFSNLSLTLNFDSVATMNKAASLKLFADDASFKTKPNDGATVVADLDEVAIQIGGKATGYTGSFSSEQGGFVIPEPSAFGLLAGAFALAIAASRRRRNA